ncbi:hypothetical protein DRE_04418 [Drechslerella stenobrocha 248]|uniref:Amino acid permease/ SLC12A domain-containing protein n=1 Tax=Drechslerella stenobrocha 248 TaxID=1043628 RepID=W7I141_9PEZI|nr:hypothetical protein DRE_04418 [Drechslerella stenobrocha 248]
MPQCAEECACRSAGGNPSVTCESDCRLPLRPETLGEHECRPSNIHIPCRFQIPIIEHDKNNLVLQDLLRKYTNVDADEIADEIPTRLPQSFYDFWVGKSLPPGPAELVAAAMEPSTLYPRPNKAKLYPVMDDDEAPMYDPLSADEAMDDVYWGQMTGREAMNPDPFMGFAGRSYVHVPDPVAKLKKLEDGGGEIAEVIRQMRRRRLTALKRALEWVVSEPPEGVGEEAWAKRQKVDEFEAGVTETILWEQSASATSQQSSDNDSYIPIALPTSSPDGDATETLNRRGSLPAEQTAPRSTGWFSRRRGSGLVGDPTGRLPKLAKSLTADEEARAKLKPKSKLGTFNGVFVPTTLNVLSILMFLRFGFLLGQSGVLGMMGMLIASYLINLVTTLSISAISTNGTVRGGGAYYLISRSLGPEFGGSIGIVFYLGYVLNTGMNAVGLVDCLMNNFGASSGDGTGVLPDSFWWRYLYATAVLVLCTIICLLGSSMFAKASNLLLVVLLVATYSIPVSTFFVKPIRSGSELLYSGPSWKTFMENLYPQFVKGAAGSESKQKDNFQSLFGILFPATGGIFAGASMSGDLRKPSKSIPKGTLHGLLITFITYTVVIFAMGTSIKRTALYTNLNVIQDVNLSATLILAGEFATCFFSALMGVIGSAKLLQALARDNIFPRFSLFAEGTRSNDEPIFAIIFTFLIGQVTLLANINQIASVVTMAYLLTFLAINLACFLLKIGAAPNFRPSFRYFRWWTACIGTVISGVTMFFVDGIYASVCVLVLTFLFLVIHYTSPPKPWGDVSQSLIYHQVRKYLLRLRQENHIKFWRPQLLLFVNDPRRSYNLIQFCNSLKKGGLYILAHVIVTPDFQESLPEAKSQQQAWMKYINFGKCKAFMQVAISPTIEWGVRNVVLSAGLGGMRPNIAILGMYNLDEYMKRKPLISLPVADDTDKDGDDEAAGSREQLPTDDCRIEQSISVTSWVNALEDMLISLQINVALAKGFKQLHIPKSGEPLQKKYIDLWPIQMSAQIASEGSSSGVLTTNFDTYTLILQLGCILNTVPTWKQAYALRVIVFVEYELDVEEEHRRVKTLLDNLRIPAEVIVCWLAKGDLGAYEAIVNGKEEGNAHVESIIGGEQWWIELQRRRREAELDISEAAFNSQLADLLKSEQWPQSTFLQQGSAAAGSKAEKFLHGVRKFVRRRKRGKSSTRFHGLGASLGTMNMQTHQLQPHVFSESESDCDSSSSDSDSSSSTESAASMNDADEYRDNYENDEAAEGPARRQRERLDLPSRRASIGGGVLLSPEQVARYQAERSPGRRVITPDPLFARGDTGTFPRTRAPAAVKRHEQTPGGTLPSRLGAPDGAKDGASSSSSSVTGAGSSAPGPAATGKRPGLGHRSSTAAFISTKIPPTQVAEQEDSGPSIMFADQEPPSKRAGGYPSGQDVPLSFNDLPSVAQYLILNELMRKYSEDTAVLFTTLPSPLAGTYKSEAASVEYISGLDGGVVT